MPVEMLLSHLHWHCHTLCLIGLHHVVIESSKMFYCILASEPFSLSVSY